LKRRLQEDRKRRSIVGQKVGDGGGGRGRRGGRKRFERKVVGAQKLEDKAKSEKKIDENDGGNNPKVKGVCLGLRGSASETKRFAVPTASIKELLGKGFSLVEVRPTHSTSVSATRC